MEIAVAVLLAVIVAIAASYLMSKPLWSALEALEDEFDEHEEVQEDLFNYSDGELYDIQERIDQLDAKIGSFGGARPPGVYDQDGNLVFPGLPEHVNPFGAVNPGEESPIFDGEGLHELVDASSTACLDGTEGNEPVDG